MPEVKPELHTNGPLTEEQERALGTFRESLQKAGIDDDALRNNVTLERFLRARKYDPDAALKQLSATQKWRRKHDVDNLYGTFDEEEMEDSRKFYPQWTGRRDKAGRPVYVYRLAALLSMQKELDSVPPARRYQRIVALYEFMTRFILPLCSALKHKPHPELPISSVATIIDLKDMPLTAMWTFRNHLQVASKLATANYPETLAITIVVNSPPFFPTVWGWIKGWFDEGTRDKIYVLGKEPGEVLRGLIDVQNLPKDYGGDLEWKFEDPPSLDEETKALLGEMPQGPKVFEDGKVTPAIDRKKG